MMESSGLSVLIYGIVFAGIFVGFAANLFTLRQILYLRPPPVPVSGKVTLILPLSGNAQNLDGLISDINRQTLPPRRLIVAVESRDDPAHQRTVSAIPLARFPIEIVVAGEASGQAQKCTNVIAAAQRVDEQDEAVVFLDGDIRPPDWWLAALTERIFRDEANVVTGYRWQYASHNRLGAFFISMIDRSLAVIPRPDWRFARVVWGGSYAVSPQILEKLNLSEILSSTLSDDLAVAVRIADLDLHVWTPESLLVPTPIDYSLPTAWKIARRQYQVIWLYRPGLWLIAFVLIAVRLMAWLAAAAAAPFSMAAAQALFALACLAVLNQLLIQFIDWRLGFSARPYERVIKIALSFALPVIDLFHLSLIVAATSKHVEWGHVSYQARSPNDIVVVGRKEWAPVSDEYG